MATTTNRTIAINSGETAGMRELYEFMRDNYSDWYSTDDTKMRLYVTELLYIDQTIDADTDNWYLYLKNDTADLVYTLISEYLAGGRTYGFQIVVSSTGDMVFKHNNTSYGGINNNTGYITFAVVDVTDVITQDAGKGVYIPLTVGGSNVFVPRHLITDDTETLITNYGNNGTQEMAYPECIYNADSKISVLVPIHSVGSQCISTNARLMELAPQLYGGDITMNGNNYYAIGLLALKESDD